MCCIYVRWKAWFPPLGLLDSASTERTSISSSPHRIAPHGIPEHRGYLYRIEDHGQTRARPSVSDCGHGAWRWGAPWPRWPSSPVCRCPMSPTWSEDEATQPWTPCGPWPGRWTCHSPAWSATGSFPMWALDVVLASAPPSLLQFSRSPDFQETVADLAERQGEPVDAMRREAAGRHGFVAPTQPGRAHRRRLAADLGCLLPDLQEAVAAPWRCAVLGPRPWGPSQRRCSDT